MFFRRHHTPLCQVVVASRERVLSVTKVGARVVYSDHENVLC